MPKLSILIYPDNRTWYTMPNEYLPLLSKIRMFLTQLIQINMLLYILKIKYNLLIKSVTFLTSPKLQTEVFVH